ncbi:LysR family transcriptional regulator [Bradyrhizobium sp. IC3069]|uniref:LysR family transcriptional regulator n=1 Tax=unclassified Bradyrhizobium TaxID=2631580 RepID=UPI001CD5CE88|nr:MULTISPECIES: LysR family transcriptional regulator [unclassified Bradyrhizobium]MCA1361178.1 LysR family transcriptional regulator [Bradyrhizobium sp. IC4059]MCA1429445.1 LysR family transcriptional regulator [Bradyrhizobium sp. NBAIM16]MCA1507561.1 LysR family transcriptional regulator [Bradyrhizobium sp. NBAIM02]MCA1511533.1 LysR family transcriptional regulator [Bradyrhizobium sp. NBAIM01]MCA1518020.1 LysR family transcriptional regulator [Bradyrhizobium sp. IC3069]
MLNQIDLSRIDLNLLVLFRVVLEERHVARAAARLSLTPSAVSHALGRLRLLLNDPLFLRTPKGVVPTARALELGEPVAEIIARVEQLIGSATPFDPEQSGRRFTIGAPDAVLVSAIGPLLQSIATAAPHIDIGLIHLMPAPRGGAIGEPWQQSLDMLERRELDIAMLPLPAVSPRFEARRLYEEEFVLAMRKRHPFAKAPTHAAFARSQHLLVSLSGEPRGFVDEMLAKRGLERRIALTVPNFMMALAQLSGSDLIAALPRRLVEQHASRFGLVLVELPFARKPDTIRAIATKAAMKDAGIAWLMQIVVGSIGAGRS